MLIKTNFCISGALMKQYGVYKGAVLPVLTHKKHVLMLDNLHEYHFIATVLGDAEAFIDWNGDMWVQVDEYGDVGVYQCVDENSIAKHKAN